MKAQRLTRFGFSIGISLLAISQAAAGWFGADFSADTYQISAGKPHYMGRMYASDGRVRTEMTVRGKPMIEIINSVKGLAWLLDPSMKTYRERPVPLQRADSNSADPCQVDTVTQCQALGEESVNGRPAKKWRLQVKQQHRVLWLDNKHHFPVQAEIDGKLVMSMRFLGKESIEARNVEKWEAMELSPSGRRVSLQWYDPQLNIAIRQQSASGEIRELRNIRLGQQQDELFILPSDYRQITLR